ncbi:MAG: F0F1 ATP synthase subunit B [Clostridia bacterium]|nr:F0F1 ATP synthase subunit B [Clostridia bacterium]
MEQYLSFVTLDIWTLIFTWVNLLILFLLVKKFFFKPMNNMLEARRAEIESDYSKAQQAQTKADKMREEYEQLLSNAHSDAERIVSDAVASASLRSDAIVKEAEEKATGMIERAQKNIDAQRRSAFVELKEDVSAMACDIARKIIQKDIDEKTHEELINKALEGLGGFDE